MSDARLKVLSQPEFTQAGARLLGGLWEAGDAEYESFWLGPSSPQRNRGEIFLLGWGTEAEPLARLALWKPGNEAGECLFFLYARSSGEDEVFIAEFLAAAKAFGRDRGMSAWTGPMAFSTWHPYRFIQRLGDAAYFPGEQKMPEEWHRDFLKAGFAPIAEYQTVWVEDLVDSLRVGRRLGIDRGLAHARVEKVDAAAMPARLPEIYRLACDIFSENFSYSPLEFSDFAALAGSGKGRDTALFLAYIGERPAGFVFSYGIGPYRAGGPGTPLRETGVLKTLGVHPDFRASGLRSLGLGYGLSYLTHEYWLGKGCESMLHPYMKADNRSRSMSGRFGSAIRDYVLLRGKL